jgi:hypothetical protein
MSPRLKFWLQEHRKETVLFTLFFLVSVISFALGYLVAGETTRAPIVIQKQSPL